MSHKFVSNKKTSKNFDIDGDENTMKKILNIVPSKPTDNNKVQSLENTMTSSFIPVPKRESRMIHRESITLQEQLDKIYGILNIDILPQISEINDNNNKIIQLLKNKLNTAEDDYKILKELNDTNIKELDEKDTELSMIKKNHDEITVELVNMRIKHNKIANDYKVLSMYFFYSAAVNCIIIAYGISYFF